MTGNNMACISPASCNSRRNASCFKLRATIWVFRRATTKMLVRVTRKFKCLTTGLTPRSSSVVSPAKTSAMASSFWWMGTTTSEGCWSPPSAPANPIVSRSEPSKKDAG